MNPVFTDNPLAAVALAEAVGELPRSLNWAAPKWAAAVQFVRALLAGQPADIPDSGWPGVPRRLGPCTAFLDVDEAEAPRSITVTARVVLRAGLIRSTPPTMTRTVLRGTSIVPRVVMSLTFLPAIGYAETPDYLLIDLWADGREEEFFSDLQALAEEVRRAKEGEG